MTDRKMETSDFLITSDLWPGDAQTVTAELIEWLAEHTSNATIELNSDTSAPTVSALQILIAAARRTDGPAPALGPTASAAVAELTTPILLKRDA